MSEFNSALFQANLLYGVDISTDKFEEIGLIAWNHIGNKRCVTYVFTGDIDKENHTIQLPCNCDIIEAVTYGFEDWNTSSNKKSYGDLGSQFTENYIEGQKMFNNTNYISGKYAKFQRDGNLLYFDKNYGKINILYKGVIVDETGLPSLNDRESLAIATYCAYVLKRKEGLMTSNIQTIQTAQLLEKEWYRLCSNARVPEYLDQNAMNEILDAKSSWNRKIFNKSYKPVQ